MGIPDEITVSICSRKFPLMITLHTETNVLHKHISVVSVCPSGDLKLQ